MVFSPLSMVLIAGIIAMADLSPARSRGQITSIYFLFTGVLGTAGGPVLVGYLNDLAGGHSLGRVLSLTGLVSCLAALALAAYTDRCAKSAARRRARPTAAPSPFDLALRTSFMRLSVSQARDLAHAAMQAVGHTPAEADIIADHLIDCELRALSFGGLPRALSVVERIQATPGSRRPMRVVKEGPTSAAIDGGDQVGYLVGQRATDMALEKARASGMAVVGAHETWYTGMYSYYLEQVTRAGFVGLVAGSAPQKVAPHGGTQARFGTNPIAFGFPADPTPVIWDIGTASIMAGEVVMHARAGTPLPEGIAFDKEGQPTRDALALGAGRLDGLGRAQGLRPRHGGPAARHDVRRGGRPGGSQRLRLLPVRGRPRPPHLGRGLSPAGERLCRQPAQHPAP